MAETAAATRLHLFKRGVAQLIHMGAEKDPLMIHDMFEKDPTKRAMEVRDQELLMMPGEAP